MATIHGMLCQALQTKHKIITKSILVACDFIQRLRDVAIVSEVIAVGSLRRVLDNKAYKRAIRFHVFIRETCLWFIPRGFFGWLI